MWAFGRFDLALPEQDFWCLTLAQLYALRERQKGKEESLDRRAALISAVVANTIPRRRGSKTFQVKDFMPGTDKIKPERKVMSDAEMEKAIRRINQALGGSVKEE